MAQNFIVCDREQELLLPPSLREWLPDGHLAWFVIDAVVEMDLGAFYAAYREDGHGRAAHDPAMMVALLLYAYAVGRRSSRVIERACVDDVAFRVIAANQRPDHCTIARFRQRQAGCEVAPGQAARGKAPPRGRARRALPGERGLRGLPRARGDEGRPPFGKPPTPYQPPATPAGKVNVTDPDSRNVKTPRGYVQGYNAQAVCNELQIVVAAEVNADSPDFDHLEPVVSAAERELADAGVAGTPAVVVADAGYWHHDQMDALASRGIQVLIPPDAGKRRGVRPGWEGGRYAFMRRVLETDLGKQLYGQRQVTVEPVFANTKFNRRLDRFLRRGRSACRSEWRLITATHNLLKLHCSQKALAMA